MNIIIRLFKLQCFCFIDAAVYKSAGCFIINTLKQSFGIMHTAQILSFEIYKPFSLVITI